jgi:hypothetical protein
MSEVEKLAGEYANNNSGNCCANDFPGLRDAFMAGYKAGFEIGCMKGSMAMQWTLDSDWHFTPSVNHQKLADRMTKKEMEKEDK